MTRVLIIIINYRTEDLLPDLLQTFQEDRVALSFAILDNGATNESFGKLSRINDDRIKLFRSDANLGFTGGINHVLESQWVQAQQFPYFLLFNPDAFSNTNLVGQLVSILQNHPQAACVSPRITYLDGKPWYQGARIHYRKGAVQMEPSNRVEQGVVTTDVFNGCVALFDMEKVKRAGYFNEALFMYYDEADLSIKLSQLGYTILFAPGLVVKHDVSYTTRKISHFKTYYMTRNKFLVFGKTMSPRYKFYFLAHELAYHGKNGRIKNMLYHLKGYLDFTMGRTGALKQHA